MKKLYLVWSLGLAALLSTQGVQVSAQTSRSVTLTWEQEPNVAPQNVIVERRIETATFGAIMTLAGNLLTWTYSTQELNKQHCYRVRNVFLVNDAPQNSEPSNEACVMVGTGTTPVTITIPKNLKVTLP